VLRPVRSAADAAYSTSFLDTLTVLALIVMWCVTVEDGGEVTQTVSQYMNIYGGWTEEQLQLITDHFNNQYVGF